MRRNRLLLCFLLGIAIVLYGVPYLDFSGGIKTVIFSVAWLLFALVAISGNLVVLLYGKRVSKNATLRQNLVTQEDKKVRNYG